MSSSAFDNLSAMVGRIRTCLRRNSSRPVPNYSGFLIDMEEFRSSADTTLLNAIALLELEQEAAVRVDAATGKASEEGLTAYLGQKLLLYFVLEALPSDARRNIEAFKGRTEGGESGGESAAQEQRPKFMNRFCSASRALQVLSESRLFLPHPQTQNDPFEFSAVADEKEPGLSVFLESVRKYSGFSSFTRHANDPLLWAHYADMHRGVCLVFNNLGSQITWWPELRPVVYSDDVTVFAGGELGKAHLAKNLDRMTRAKGARWRYEEEWRFVQVWWEEPAPEKRWLHFPKSGLRKVILGDRIDPLARKEICKKWAEKCTVKLNDAVAELPFLVYQARVLPGANRLRFKLIPKNFDYRDHAMWDQLGEDVTDEPFPPFLMPRREEDEA